MPEDDCETYVNPWESCWNSANTICFSWLIVLVGIIIANSVQMMFEISMLFSLEITYRTTELEKMSDPERYSEEDINQETSDMRKEPPCSKVLPKCAGELIFIITFLSVSFLLILCGFYSMRYGSFMTQFIEFGIAYALDQLKSCFLQPLIYFFIVKRVGALKPAEE